MGCTKCDNELIQTYKKLSYHNGKTYIKYKIGNNTKIAEENDFELLKHIQEIPKETKGEILV